jgi:hypothetical protein
MPAGMPPRRCRAATLTGRFPESDQARGLVIPAVLLTVTVMILGVLALVSRVAATRESAAASSLAASARQAAEYGFSQAVAEMNRDGKSYLWVTPFANWASVTDSDLRSCGIFSASVPSTNPIPGRSSPVDLPATTNLSYQVTGYQPPEVLGSSCSFFGNRKGGSGTLEITGTARRASGDPNPASYTLRRAVTVGQAVPLFRTSVFRGTSWSSGVNVPASPHFPTPAALGVTPLAPPWPAVSCTGTGATSPFSCTSASVTYSFAKSTTSPVNTNRFPYDSTGSLPNFCRQATTPTVLIVCMVSSLTLTGTFDLVVNVATPVIFFVDSGNLTVPQSGSLCSSAVNSTSAAADSCAGASGDWQRLQLYGRASAASCDQAVTLNRVNLTGGNFRTNLHNAFLWFPTATLSYDANTNVFYTLVGSVCQLSPSIPTTSANTIQLVSPDQLRDFLASQRLLFYRGYGAWQQNFQPQ